MILFNWDYTGNVININGPQEIFGVSDYANEDVWIFGNRTETLQLDSVIILPEKPFFRITFRKKKNL